MRITKTSRPSRISFLVLALLVAGCSLEKKSGFNRTMQNLTAHYNIVFDANELLRQKQDAYAVSFVDAYNEVLSVYQDTTAQTGTLDKDLEEVKVKGGKIINIKEQSHYIGDAYMIKGKASYLEGDYFAAGEFFSYVIRSFPQQPKLVEEARVWNARTMIRLNYLPKAKESLDSAVSYIDKKTPKATLASLYATYLQYDIDVQNYQEGEQMAVKAIQYSRDKTQRLRWTFIMAQLQELNNKPKDAFNNYTNIVNSNVAFEMAFNANLNRIRIEENQNGAKINRIDRLRALIKNENNKDFIDQIYYQVAQLSYADKKTDEAIKNYRLSVRYSKKNLNQKGLSYLRLADIFFKDKQDYVSAKKYYDSTLMALSPAYPGYQIIKKKGDNLQLLADRFGIITREELLQSLAKLDEKSRNARIDSMVNAEILHRQTQANVDNNTTNELAGTGPQAGAARSNFYFYNSATLSQGYNDFKRKWGNRKLEDNWRRSSRTSSDITASSSQNLDPDAPAGQAAKAIPTAGDFRKQLTQNLPLTPDLVAKSNQRIYNAYLDVANFYRDVLGDRKEAIATFELLLSRFPDLADKPALYYNLYRLYSDENNTARAEEYKNLILKGYAESTYAKIIIDPEYGRKANDADAELMDDYNRVYDAYANGDYKEAIKRIDNLGRQKPDNKWSSQLAYLRAISQGHLEKFDPFRADLVQITTKYPEDKLITPLVKQHITYIDAHKDALDKRPFVITDKDPNEEPFIPKMSDEEIAAIRVANLQAERQAAAYKQAQAYKDSVAKAEAKKLALKNDSLAKLQSNKLVEQQANNVQGKAPAVSNPAAANPTVADQPKRVVPSAFFSMNDSTNYYFVVNVSTQTINLASSRFGIGQFNRANYPPGSLSHQLVGIGDNNQLVYVGRFYSLKAVKDYARAIIPLMPDIMKVPKGQYTFFIITKQNLDKLNSKTMLDNYTEYYQNNY